VSTVAEGVRASADIPAGSLLIREKPHCTADFTLSDNKDFAKTIASLQAQLSSGLPPSIKDELTKAMPNSAQALARHCMAFGGEEGSTGMVAAVLPKIAALAHSDTPNCTLSVAWGFRVNDRIIVSVLALRDISAGEHLTIAHTTSLVDPRRRQARLQWLQRKPAGGTEPQAAWVQPLTAVKSGGSVSAELGADFDHVPPSGTVNKGTAPQAFESSLAFLVKATASLEETHWMMLAARRTCIVSLMYLGKWPAAWSQLRAQTRAVFSMLPLAHVEAQYHTHALAEHILRAWNVEDTSAAAAASIGAMMRYTSALQDEKNRAAGTARAPSPIPTSLATAMASQAQAEVKGTENGDDDAATEEELKRAAVANSAALAAAAVRIAGHEDAWVCNMLHGAQVLRAAQQQGFVNGPPPGM
jgi:hypothetical protein